MMKRFGFWLAIVIVSATLSISGAWADGYNTPPTPPPGSAPMVAAPMMPGPATPALARIYFYRLVGSYQFPRFTSVSLNDANVGDVGPGGYFFRDVPPGTYKVGVYSDVPYPDQYETVTVTPGSTNYIEVFNVPGYGITFTMGPPASVNMPSVFGNRLVDPAVARQRMIGLTPNGG